MLPCDILCETCADTIVLLNSKTVELTYTLEYSTIADHVEDSGEIQSDHSARGVRNDAVGRVSILQIIAMLNA